MEVWLLTVHNHLISLASTKVGDHVHSRRFIWTATYLSYGKVTLHQARVAAQKVLAAKLEGRDPAREKRDARIREVTDRVTDTLETYIAERLSGNRSAAEISRLLWREVDGTWRHKSIHEIFLSRS